MAAFHTGIMLVALYFFRQWFERVSPLEPRHTRALFVEFHSVARASILGTSLAALFQAVAQNRRNPQASGAVLTCPTSMITEDTNERSHRFG